MIIEKAYYPCEFNPQFNYIFESKVKVKINDGQKTSDSSLMESGRNKVLQQSVFSLGPFDVEKGQDFHTYSEGCVLSTNSQA
jgi:hypothetical protein